LIRSELEILFSLEKRLTFALQNQKVMEKEELNLWMAKIAKSGLVSNDDDVMMYLKNEKFVEVSELNYQGEKNELQEISDLLSTKFNHCKRFIINMKGAHLKVSDVNNICNCFSPKMGGDANVIWDYDMDPSIKDTKVLIIGSY